MIAEKDSQLAPSLTSENPLVSIIIPDYNHADYLGPAILSVLNQNYAPVEIIVVDDGSSDNSRQVVGQFGNKVVYLWQANSGLSAARNAGIRTARGILIGFLDADDLYEPDFLKLLVPRILSCPPEYGAVYGGFRFVDPQGTALPQKWAGAIPPEIFHDKLVDGNFLAAHCLLIKKDCFEKVGVFDETLRSCEDWDMWLRISSQFKIAGDQNIIANYRIQPQSMSSDPRRMLNNRLRVLEKNFNLDPGKTEVCPNNPRCRRAFSRAYFSAAIEYLQQNANERFLHYLQVAFNQYPPLVQELDVFYEMGCGNQPKGYRGDFSSLDIRQSENLILDMLEKIFNSPEMPAELGRQKPSAYASAFQVLGTLNYGKHRYGAARRFWRAAIRNDPRLFFHKQVGLAYLKSFIKPLVH